jgi:hypothetical protein
MAEGWLLNLIYLSACLANGVHMAEGGLMDDSSNACCPGPFDGVAKEGVAPSAGNSMMTRTPVVNPWWFYLSKTIWWFCLSSGHSGCKALGCVPAGAAPILGCVRIHA